MVQLIFNCIAVVRRSSQDSGDSAEETSAAAEASKLKPFMVDVTVYFHDVSEEDVKKLKRYLIAYPLNEY